MEQPATVPCWIIRRALDHGATSCDTGHRVCKDPVRAIMCLDHVLHGEMPECCLPVHWWQLLRKVELPRRANQISLRRVRREHGPHLILLAFEPVDEQKLHRATAIPVALLVIRLHASDASAK